MIILLTTFAFSQDYFSPVDPTGMPYTIVVSDAYINGLELSNGAEIGVFNHSICVGSGIYEQSESTTISSWEGNLNLDLEGFSQGENIFYNIWIDSFDQEYSGTASYTQGDGTFGSGSYTVVRLDILDPNFIDVNSDLNIDVFDIMVLISSILTNDLYNYQVDLNQDSQLSMEDILEYLELIMGQNYA
tara:strand:- start:18 stop:581 length:564 start_codon:yes stop_codon:yes gene_type:complete